MMMLYSVKALALLIIIWSSTIQATPVLLQPSKESPSSDHDTGIPDLPESLGPVIPSTKVFENETWSKDEPPFPLPSIPYKGHPIIWPPYSHKNDEQKKGGKPKRIPEEPKRQDKDMHPWLDKVQEHLDYLNAIKESRYDREKHFASRPTLQHDHEAQEATDDEKPVKGEKWQSFDQGVMEVPKKNQA
ncbi:hypothetical protein NW762_004899 [Fusarium torreyae]|uniref:Secreted protein n=1 Tax=Fusarium torreyae TaxID=1237075 RepID=A0A9W8S7C5_9HYPO|nr:hypothetical protein NW762_004899 [Fusarium torreyae]